MNYYDARQIPEGSGEADAGLWRYTRRNDGRFWEIGNCASCPGHATREEAFEHQRQYDLAEAAEAIAEGRVHKTDPWTPCQVEDCGKRTPNMLDVGPGGGIPVHLCDLHLDPERIAAVYEGPGVITSSF